MKKNSKKNTKKTVFTVCGIGVAACVGLSALGAASTSSKASDYRDYRANASNSSNASSGSKSGYDSSASYAETMAYYEDGYYEDMCYEEDYCDEPAYYEEELSVAEKLDYGEVNFGMSTSPESAGFAATGDSMSASTNQSSSEDFQWKEGEGSGNVTGQTATEARKLIRTVALSVETLTFDEFMTALQERTYAYGGYVDSLETWNNSRNAQKINKRDAYLIVKIPSDSLVAFTDEIGGNCNVLTKSEEVNDVTGQYTNYESRKKVLLAEEERLLTFMEQADTIDEIMKIEARLTEVQSEIDSIESSLRTYDNLISYSTVKINVYEVVEFTEEPEPEPEPEEKEPTFLESMQDNFMTSVKNLVEGAKCVALWFASNVIWMVFVLIVVLVIVVKVKRAGKKIKAQTPACVDVPVKEVIPVIVPETKKMTQAETKPENGAHKEEESKENETK